VIQKSHDLRGRILERNRRSRGVHGRRSTRSNGKIRRRIETRRKSDTVEGENLRPRLSYTQRRNRC